MIHVIISDLHLTNSPQDEYRWKWMSDFTDWVSANVDDFIHDVVIDILGDITENKDKHSGSLVNRFIEYLCEWMRHVSSIRVITGNHDGIDVDKPFFKFIHNQNNRMEWITKPSKIDDCLYLPHSKNPIDDWSDINMTEVKYIFMHQSVNSAVTSNDYEMQDALTPDFFKTFNGTVFSGDIHVPQQINNIIYVGSPYPIYFGDNFSGRFVVLDSNKITTVMIKSINKLKLRISSMEQLRETAIEKNDQIAVEFMISRLEQYKASDIRSEIKNYIKSKKAHLMSLELIVPRSNTSLKSRRVRLRRAMSDEEYVRVYADKNELDSDYIEVGMRMLTQKERGE